MLRLVSVEVANHAEIPDDSVRLTNQVFGWLQGYDAGEFPSELPPLAAERLRTEYGVAEKGPIAAEELLAQAYADLLQIKNPRVQQDARLYLSGLPEDLLRQISPRYAVSLKSLRKLLGSSLAVEAQPVAQTVATVLGDTVMAAEVSVGEAIPEQEIATHDDLPKVLQQVGAAAVSLAEEPAPIVQPSAVAPTAPQPRDVPPQNTPQATPVQPVAPKPNTEPAPSAPAKVTEPPIAAAVPEHHAPQPKRNGYSPEDLAEFLDVPVKMVKQSIKDLAGRGVIRAVKRPGSNGTVSWHIPGEPSDKLIEDIQRRKQATT